MENIGASDKAQLIFILTPWANAKNSALRAVIEKEKIIHVLTVLIKSVFYFWD